MLSFSHSEGIDTKPTLPAEDNAGTVSLPVLEVVAVGVRKVAAALAAIMGLPGDTNLPPRRETAPRAEATVVAAASVMVGMLEESPPALLSALPSAPNRTCLPLPVLVALPTAVGKCWNV